MTSIVIDEEYWRTFAIKFAKKRGVTNPEILLDISQDAMAKVYSLDLSRMKTQIEVERFVGRSVANMIRDWQRKEIPRTHSQLYEFATVGLSTSNRIEDYFVDYLDSIIPNRLTFADGQEALIDSADWDKVDEHKWHITNVGRKTYARTWQDGKHIYLHRLITASLVKPKKFKNGIPCTFINGDTLDCRRSNLTLGSIPLLDLL